MSIYRLLIKKLVNYSKHDSSWRFNAPHSLPTQLLSHVVNWHVFVVTKVCSKYYFLFPQIDKIIDVNVGYHRLSFMDAFAKYNKTKMILGDAKKIAFITEKNIYYYLYQRLVSQLLFLVYLTKQWRLTLMTC